MRKYLLLLGLIAALSFIATIDKFFLAVKHNPPFGKITPAVIASKEYYLSEAMKLLKFRDDQAALLRFESILFSDPQNNDALWGKAEVLRRRRFYKQAEGMLRDILRNNKFHTPSMISLANIRCKEGKLDEAEKLITQALRTGCRDNDDEALAYVVSSSIDGKRVESGGVLSKVKYGTRIKAKLLKAERLSFDLPETHLGLGTFYLLAPAVVGGNLSKAEDELLLTVELAPAFATANARLAQVYKKKGDLGKFKLYFTRAKDFDPDNEVLKEMESLGTKGNG